MSITEDAAEIVKYIYNRKVDGRRSVSTTELASLDMNGTQIENAYEFLVDKGFITKGRPTLGRTTKNLPTIFDIRLTSDGVDMIESNQKSQEFAPGISVKIEKQNGHIHNLILTSTRDESPVNIATQDSSEKYEIDKADTQLINIITKKVSVKLSKYNENRLEKGSILSTFGGLITFIGSVYSAIPYSAKPLANWLSLSFTLAAILAIIGLIFFFLGLFIIRSIRYKHYDKCEKCGEHYKLKEIGQPKAKLEKTHEGPQVTKYRTYKCEACGHVQKKKRRSLLKNNF